MRRGAFVDRGRRRKMDSRDGLTGGGARMMDLQDVFDRERRRMMDSRDGLNRGGGE